VEATGEERRVLLGEARRLLSRLGEGLLGGGREKVMGGGGEEEEEDPPMVEVFGDV
jgi:hypothetical protein